MQKHGDGGGHQSAVSDDLNLAVEFSDLEPGHRHAGHGRGQIDDCALEGVAGQSLIEQQRQQQYEQQVKE